MSPSDVKMTKAEIITMIQNEGFDLVERKRAYDLVERVAAQWNGI